MIPGLINYVTYIVLKKGFNHSCHDCLCIYEEDTSLLKDSSLMVYHLEEPDNPWDYWTNSGCCLKAILTEVDLNILIRATLEPAITTTPEYMFHKIMYDWLNQIKCLNNKKENPF